MWWAHVATLFVLSKFHILAKSWTTLIGRPVRGTCRTLFGHVVPASTVFIGSTRSVLSSDVQGVELVGSQAASAHQHENGRGGFRGILVPRKAPPPDSPGAIHRRQRHEIRRKHGCNRWEMNNKGRAHLDQCSVSDCPRPLHEHLLVFLVLSVFATQGDRGCVFPVIGQPTLPNQALLRRAESGTFGGTVVGNLYAWGRERGLPT